ncbi:MAG TPA: class I SAM-dependent methyltransferase [Alphaproteobacteria bacterium]|nr:class I SAM-dependent methyltransferase [Alphaproteobacteria bacterium]
MQMARAASDAAEIERALVTASARLRRRDADAARRVQRALDLWRRTPDAFCAMTDILCIAGATPEAGQTLEQGIAHWAAVFDRAAAVSPEASVALYSLGDAELLHNVTREVTDWMLARGLLTSDGAILEIGCGIGRFVGMLAPLVRFAIGIDVSQRMLDIARRRCADASSATFARSSGRDLAAFRDESIDLVYAVDTFPYLVQLSGDIARLHIREAARVLRPGGRLLILNYSYRGSIESDRRDIDEAARGTGLSIVCHGTREFALWDGTAFLMTRA